MAPGNEKEIHFLFQVKSHFYLNPV